MLGERAALVLPTERIISQNPFLLPPKGGMSPGWRLTAWPKRVWVRTDIGSEWHSRCSCSMLPVPEFQKRASSNGQSRPRKTNTKACWGFLTFMVAMLMTPTTRPHSQAPGYLKNKKKIKKKRVPGLAPCRAIPLAPKQPTGSTDHNPTFRGINQDSVRTSGEWVWCGVHRDDVVGWLGTAGRDAGYRT